MEDAKEKAKSVGVNAEDCDNWGQVIDLIFEEKVEPSLIQPALQLLLLTPSCSFETPPYISHGKTSKISFI